MNREDFTSKISEFSKLCISEIELNGSDESKHLTIEVASEIISISEANIEFIESSILGNCLYSYVLEVLASHKPNKSELIRNSIFVVWSFIDSISDDETRELLSHSIKDQESFDNFASYILFSKDDVESE